MNIPPRERRTAAGRSILNQKVPYSCATVSVGAAPTVSERLSPWKQVGERLRYVWIESWVTGGLRWGKSVENLLNPPSRSRLCWLPQIWPLFLFSHCLLFLHCLCPTVLQPGRARQPRRSTAGACCVSLGARR